MAKYTCEICQKEFDEEEKN